MTRWVVHVYTRDRKLRLLSRSIHRVRLETQYSIPKAPCAYRYRSILFDHLAIEEIWITWDCIRKIRCYGYFSLQLQVFPLSTHLQKCILLVATKTFFIIIIYRAGAYNHWILYGQTPAPTETICTCHIWKLLQCTSLFKKLRLVKLADLFTLNVLKMYYKFKHARLPSYVENMSEDFSRHHEHETRQSLIFEEPMVNTASGENCMRYILPRIVNDTNPIIINMVDSYSFEGFVRYLKNYMIVHYVDYSELLYL